MTQERLADWQDSVDWVALGRAVDAEKVRMTHHEDPSPVPIQGTYTIEALRRVLAHTPRYGLIEEAQAVYNRESHEIVNLGNLATANQALKDLRLARRLEGADLRRAVAEDLRAQAWRIKGKYKLEGFQLAIKWLQGSDLGE
jgi:hypothetical protein